MTLPTEVRDRPPASPRGEESPGGFVLVGQKDGRYGHERPDGSGDVRSMVHPVPACHGTRCRDVSGTSGRVSTPGHGPRAASRGTERTVGGMRHRGKGGASSGNVVRGGPTPHRHDPSTGNGKVTLPGGYRAARTGCCHQRQADERAMDAQQGSTHSNDSTHDNRIGHSRVVSHGSAPMPHRARRAGRSNGLGQPHQTACRCRGRGVGQARSSATRSARLPVGSNRRPASPVALRLAVGRTSDTGLIHANTKGVA